MPRIRHSIPIPKTCFTDTTNLIQSALFYPASHDTVHTLFAPQHYEPGYAYPLIVWLHGNGGDERQLRLIMPFVSMRNYIAVAPQGVCVKDSGSDKATGYGWPLDDEHISEVEQHIFDAIEAAARKFHICEQRIFLAGFDSGGVMAFRLALSHPQHFAGILSICGALPNGGTPFANLPLARKLPIFLCVGRDSKKYPAAEVCENLRLLHSAGMLVTLRQYPCGHELTPQMLSDVDRWIIEQITSTDSVQTTTNQWAYEPE